FLIEHSFLTMVPFDEEWRFVENYLELEELRFRDSLAVSMEREGDFSGICIPPLTIQPLVENALKHGVQKRGGQGSVSVCAMTAGGRVTIAVADNGTGLDSSDLFSRSLGNIRKRLHHCFGEADIALESERGRGVTVTVTFPCETAAAEQSA
nr:histidine kinase [Spirochaetota bacterium]